MNKTKREVSKLNSRLLFSIC